MTHWRALNAGERFTHTAILCVRPLATRQQKIGGGEIKARPEIARGRCFFMCRIMWWQWVTPLGFSFKMADLPPKKDTCCSLSVWVYACAWAWCFCVLFFSLCLSKLRSYAYVYTDSSQVFTQIVKQFVSLKLAHMWNLHGDWLHTKQCGRASIKVCSQIRRQI